MTPSTQPDTAWPWLALGGIALAVGAVIVSGWWGSDPAGPVAPAAAQAASASQSKGPVARDATTPAPPALSVMALQASRYQLQGVVAGAVAQAEEGVALMSVDGAAARAYRVGEAVGAELVLLGVSPGGAILGSTSGTPLLVLEISAGTPSPVQAPNNAASANAADPGVALPAADLDSASMVAAQARTNQQAGGRRPRLKHP